MLSQKAILVRFSVSQWTARKFDKKATQEVEANHGANKHAGEVGRFNKQLASKKYMTDMNTNISAAREFHYKQTLPWQDAEGIRILPVNNFSSYQQSMSEFRTKHEEHLDTFVKQYPDVVDEAKYRLNGLFNIEDFPPVDQIRDKFSWEISFSPVPESGDFRVSLGQEVLKQMEADLSKRLSHNYNEACVDLFQRIQTQTANMAERLENYQGTREGAFRDSLVGNIRELAQLLPKLNVSGDKRLADLAARIDKELCEYDAQVLREVDGARKDVAQSAKSIAQEADDIIAEMRGMFA
jgi:hypothetical protein